MSDDQQQDESGTLNLQDAMMAEFEKMQAAAADETPAEETAAADETKTGEEEPDSDQTGDGEGEKPDTDSVWNEYVAGLDENVRQVVSQMDESALGQMRGLFEERNTAVAQAQEREEKLTEATTSLEKFGRAIGPYKDALNNAGMDDAQFVATLVEYKRQLDADPSKGIAALRKSYGLTPDGDTKTPDGDVDDVDTSNPDVAKLNRRIDELEGNSKKQRAEREAAEQKRIAEEIKAFREAKDDKGNLKHPHYSNEKVQQHMAMLLEGGFENDIGKLYRAAVMAIDETRTKVIEAETKAAIAKAKADSEAEVKKRAKEASKKATAAAGTGDTTKVTDAKQKSDKPPSIEDTMMAEWQKMERSASA